MYRKGNNEVRKETKRQEMKQGGKDSNKKLGKQKGT